MVNTESFVTKETNTKPRIYTTRYLCLVDFCTPEALKINNHIRQQHGFTGKKAERYIKKAVKLLDFSQEDSNQENLRENLKSIDTDLLADDDLSAVSCTSTFELKTIQEIEEESDEREEESHY